MRFNLNQLDVVSRTGLQWAASMALISAVAAAVDLPLLSDYLQMDPGWEPSPAQWAVSAGLALALFQFFEIGYEGESAEPFRSWIGWIHTSTAVLGGWWAVRLGVSAVWSVHLAVFLAYLSTSPLFIWVAYQVRPGSPGHDRLRQPRVAALLTGLCVLVAAAIWTAVSCLPMAVTDDGQILSFYHPELVSALGGAGRAALGVLLLAGVVGWVSLGLAVRGLRHALNVSSQAFGIHVLAFLAHLALVLLGASGWAGMDPGLGLLSMPLLLLLFPQVSALGISLGVFPPDLEPITEERTPPGALSC